MTYYARYANPCLWREQRYSCKLPSLKNTKRLRRRDLMVTGKSAVFTSTLLLASFLLSSLTVAAQRNSSDWFQVKSIQTGSKLSVKLKSGKTIDGRFISVSDVALSVTVKNAPRELKREDVLTIHETIKKKSSTKATLIGLGLGAGAGALTGYLLGRGGSKRVLIYESK